MNIKIDFENNFNKATHEWESKKRIALEKIGLKATNLWVKLITSKNIVDTGRFRNSVNYVAKKDEVIVGSGVEYATFLELGTYKMKARPTLEPTILENRELYKDIIKKEMEK